MAVTDDLAARRVARLLCRAIVLLVALAACLATAIVPAHAQDSPQKPRHDITDYMRLPGDQAVVVPNGTYRAGDVRKAHAETNGKYAGWLVLVAESKGGVVVDMNDGGLT